MSLIKKPSELEVNETLCALIYGVPGAGKTSVGVSSPNPVLFDFDGGVKRIEAQFRVDTVQMKSWEETLQALAEVEADTSYKTIVVDTIGKMMVFLDDYIKRVETKNTPGLLKRDGSLSLKGFGVRKQKFIEFNNRLKMAGRHVVYIAHEREEKQKFDRDEITVKRPEIPGSTINDLIKELDLVGYMWYNGTNRVVSFDPQETFYAKNSCGMHGAVEVPNVGPNDENTFMCDVIKAYHSRLKEAQENTIRYDELKKEIIEKGETIVSSETANQYIEWVKTINHIFNTKLFALKVLNDKATALGLKYDNKTKKYE